MKVFLNKTVLESAKDRMRWVFEEFPNVVVSTSGGKDSTVVFHLALEVARELNRLPLKVLFLDQEAEWQATIDSVRYMMEHPDVEPYWMQIPFRLFNATSTEEHWLKCWEPGKEAQWMRPQESYSYKENNFGTDRFSKLFRAMAPVLWPNQRTAFLAGVRCEESPSRSVGLTYHKKYKWVTWGTGHSGKPSGNFTFYPIYDWSTSDVWKAIHQHSWPYCGLYDAMFRYGVKVPNMRVSNVHHETAVWVLFVIQEIEPNTYQRLVGRIQGIDMAGKMGIEDYFPKALPSMFGSWKEYREFLLEKLITKPEWIKTFRKNFDRQDAMFAADGDNNGLWRMHVTCILCNDWEGIKMVNYQNASQNIDKVKQYRSKRRAAADLLELEAAEKENEV